jgi:hypothetical protein
MFGHQDDQSTQTDDTQDNASPEPEQTVVAAEPVGHGDPVVDSLQADTGDSSSEADTVTTPDPAPATDTSDDQAWQHPGTPIEDRSEPISDVVSPAGGFPRSTDTQVASHHGTNNSSDDLIDTNSAVNDLVDIRQHALTELAPLMDQLDLGPEEKFRTVMMVIQASDDQNLIKDAYEAAHGITDEKARAQALLDIVNEINYFAQPPAES